MAVYVTVKWYDKDILSSTNEVKISDIVSKHHLVNVYQNFRFDDYYLIKEAEQTVSNYILNSWKHKYYSAKVKEDFLPLIIIEEDPNV